MLAHLQFVYFPGLQAASSANSQFSALFSLYARPATKLGPFLIGLLIGIKTIRKEQLALQQSSARSLFICGLGLAFAVIYGILPEYWHPEQGNTLYNTLYTATFRTLFAIAIGMIIVSRLCRNDRLLVLTFLNRKKLNLPLVNNQFRQFGQHLRN